MYTFQQKKLAHLQSILYSVYDTSLSCRSFHDNPGGLSQQEVNERQQQYGANFIRITVRPIYRLILKEVFSQILYIAQNNLANLFFFFKKDFKSFLLVPILYYRRLDGASLLRLFSHGHCCYNGGSRLQRLRNEKSNPITFKMM